MYLGYLYLEVLDLGATFNLKWSIAKRLKYFKGLMPGETLDLYNNCLFFILKDIFVSSLYILATLTYNC